MLYLLQVDGAAYEVYLKYGFFIILAIFIWFILLRWATRADNIVKNQQIMIDIMIRKYIQDGATPEEIDKLKKNMGLK